MSIKLVPPVGKGTKFSPMTNGCTPTCRVMRVPQKACHGEVPLGEGGFYGGRSQSCKDPEGHTCRRENGNCANVQALR